MPGDLKDPEYCRSIVERTVDEFGGLDILVNNGGKQVTCESVTDISDEQSDHTLKTNVYAMFWITKASPRRWAGQGSRRSSPRRTCSSPQPSRVTWPVRPSA